MIERLQATLIAVGVSLVVGFSAGYYTKYQFGLADTVKQAGKANRETAENIVTSVEKSNQVDASIQKSDTDIDLIKKAVNDRLTKGGVHDRLTNSFNVPKPNGSTAGASGEQVDQACPDSRIPDVLDNGTVRLLNAARQSRELESSSIDAR